MSDRNIVTSTEVVPDGPALRSARRDRVLAEMEAADVDLLVVGREANARYVSGAPRLWVAGSRPFLPGCVLVRETGAVHLMSTWDEGVPEDIPHENLYGTTFNPGNFVKALRGIDGAAGARTVAADALNPTAAGLLPRSFPAARMVDGDRLMQRARRVKTPEEVDAIHASVQVAEQALSAAEAALEPGVTERQLTGVFMETMAAAGVTTPSTQDVAWITSRDHPWRRAGRDVSAVAGDLVAFEPGVILAGYVGEVARTRPVGDLTAAATALYQRRDELWDRLLGACRPGLPLSDLLEAYADAGEAAPPVPVARGLGLGFDEPVVSHDLPGTAAGEILEVGMVLALTAFVWQEGVGAVYGMEPVVITEDGLEMLATTPFQDQWAW